MRRLAKKTNILPVLARADCLTDDMLATIKKVVKRDLDAAGLDLGVFGSEDRAETPRNSHVNGRGNPNKTNGAHAQTQAEREQDEDGSEPEEGEEEEVEERRSRPVIKLRAASRSSRFKMPWNRSRSRTRLEEAEPADEPTSVENMDTESVASVRFSARRVGASPLGELLPFAFIAPEPSRHRMPSLVPPPIPDDRQSVHTDAGGVSPSDDVHTSAESVVVVSSPVSVHRHAPFLAHPPADLRGVFIRKYRWGTIDVLSPEHCDFAALRTAVLSTHMKVCTSFFFSFADEAFFFSQTVLCRC